MISISEKDGATIIVIENPTGSEQRLIKQAKKTKQAISDDVWAKFACNKGKSQKKPEKSPAPQTNASWVENFNTSDGFVNLIDFEICGLEDCPF